MAGQSEIGNQLQFNTPKVLRLKWEIMRQDNAEIENRKSYGKTI